MKYSSVKPKPTLFFVGCASLVLAIFASLSFAQAQYDQDAADYLPTPPRLSLVEGAASFWRPGTETWVPAQLNTPLAAGDVLYTNGRANIEVQIGAHAFARMTREAVLTLVSQEQGYQQFKLTGGQVAFDLRGLPAGQTLEVNTPNAAFTIRSNGYYRVELVGENTHLILRRGGRATVLLADGHANSLVTNEEVVVRNGSSRDGAEQGIETYVAPQLDRWDRWNYARSDRFDDAISHRYVPREVYGADELDNYGTWQVVERYGAVWVPQNIAPGWAPYTSGSWVWDPRYGWTWVDQAPWGWAPYHYGRWVSLNGYWAWAPGPATRRPSYAPALVAFYGFGRSNFEETRVGGPNVGWVALGWGEPVFPWWGRPRYQGRPSWGGWGGPRVVNNVVINNTTVVNVSNITYQNAVVPNAVVAARQDGFGAGRLPLTRITPEQRAKLIPLQAAPPVQPRLVQGLTNTAVNVVTNAASNAAGGATGSAAGSVIALPPQNGRSNDRTAVKVVEPPRSALTRAIVAAQTQASTGVAPMKPATLNVQTAPLAPAAQPSQPVQVMRPSLEGGLQRGVQENLRRNLQINAQENLPANASVNGNPAANQNPPLENGGKGPLRFVPQGSRAVQQVLPSREIPSGSQGVMPSPSTALPPAPVAPAHTANRVNAANSGGDGSTIKSVAAPELGPRPPFGHRGGVERGQPATPLLLPGVTHDVRPIQPKVERVEKPQDVKPMVKIERPPRVEREQENGKRDLPGQPADRLSPKDEQALLKAQAEMMRLKKEMEDRRK